MSMTEMQAEDSGPDDRRAALARQLAEWVEQGKLAAAIDHWKTLPEDSIGAHLNTVAALLNKRGMDVFALGRIGEALNLFFMALRARPESASTLNNAATCLKELGQLDESTALYRKALALKPGFAAAYSNLLMNMQYGPNITPPALAAAQREWDERHGKIPRAANYANAREPERALRIGLVSGDLGDHPVGYCLVRFLESHDRANFVFAAYVDGRREGKITDRLRAAVEHWHDTEGVRDGELAAKIHADGVDILIDLAGHTGSRLGVFARKPAPVQMAWMGYPGDTGLSAMDYVIGDRFVLPQEMQPHCRAKILQLPDNFICFDPPQDAPPVGPLHATAPGQITFGAMHNPVKCNDEVIGLWAEILKRLPQSRLLLKYKGFGEAMCRERFLAKFAAAGIGPAQLEFQGASRLPELFALMQAIDLALDPFPFAGGLMTCLSLWMGVPVVTLPGETFASRQGLGFLTSLGITDTIASDCQDYVEKAVTLAQDLPRLADLRRRLRPAMEASPLCDGKRAAAGLQDLLRGAWRAWCGKA